MKSIHYYLLPVLLVIITTQSPAQQIAHYNLAELLQQGKLMTAAGHQPTLLTDTQKNAITTKGLVWLTGTNFKEGTIDVDLRGKDIFLQSFLGIAFHAVDTLNYEVVYFRPFNFRHADTLRRKWSVQYMALPEYDYTVLRAAHPLQYENAVVPVPMASDWFHATIVVKDETITVYVNHSRQSCLTAKKLKNNINGMIGLWDSGITGDFANLVISQRHSS